MTEEAQVSSLTIPKFANDTRQALFNMLMGVKASETVWETLNAESVKSSSHGNILDDVEFALHNLKLEVEASIDAFTKTILIYGGKIDKHPYELAEAKKRQEKTDSKTEERQEEIEAEQGNEE